MKKITAIWVLFALTLATVTSCSGTKETETNVKDELYDFRNWVSTATSNVADKTEEEWKQIKAEFNEQTANLDQVQDNFTDEVKEEYKQLKQNFQDADMEYRSMNKDGMVMEWQQKLLGNWSDLSTVNENNVQEAYITFMENVRTMKGNWTDREWEGAKMVLENLNQRREEFTGNVPTETEVKIKALQMEFRTLETAADATDDN